MQRKLLLSALLTAISSTAIAQTELETVTVNADFRATDIENSSTSVSVIDSIELNKRNAQHMQDALNLAPNVNFASGASRGNYVQIRGIGERSQFETPINPSVGLSIDGIDYSRTGSAGLLFDTKQVEILRGPQGTVFGASGMAGMVVITSNEPTKDTEGYVSQGFGSYNTSTTEAAIGGTIIEDKLLGRLGVHSHQSDGYITNEYLERDDTNNQDEMAARAQFKWFASDTLTFDITAMHIKTNNGYDAFNLENGYTTESDTPGKDALDSSALSVKATWKINPAVIMQTTLSASNSDIEYSYDEDWVYAGKFDENLYPYNYFDEYLRDRQNSTAEVRLLSSEQGRIFNNTTDWVIGAYQNRQDEGLVRNRDKDTADGNTPTTVTTSQFDTINSALYGQLDYHATPALTYSFGLRGERYESDYTDSNGENNQVNETLFGGKLAAQYQINPLHNSVTSLSRGFKAGGVNSSPLLDSQYRNFTPEYLWNLETGLNSSFMDNALKTRITVFYSWRDNPQTSNSAYNPDEQEFVAYTGNTERGYNYGLEAEFDWHLNDEWRAIGSLGLLQSGLSAYTYTGTYGEEFFIAEGRDQAHAPNYQFSIGAEYYFAANWTLAMNIEGKDGFYYSDNHNETSSGYELVNASLEYAENNWTLTLWARNLLNREYDVRGFYFGNDPSAEYASMVYTQKGEPRMLGLNFRYDF
ncbi:TonB-dependent receptor [Thiosulfatimonas sediminis]|uniref:TonB-dependent receptor n=1 Tax=Thiosulfatimonas sediminis TaxID=2675054 RepID=A0A6F8PWS3_9GAMM|nr:TonB-dependent receptor [Thiosulfatimonas sediminis]BBP46448.1 TonB-dependent receptor [Thiosulfatimonas sediminis]